MWLIWQDVFALHKCHVSVLALDLGQRCSWAPLWAEIPQGQASKNPRDGKYWDNHCGWEVGGVLWKCSGHWKWNLTDTTPQLTSSVCHYVLGSNLVLTQPWDCFLNATTAATCFCCFGVFGGDITIIPKHSFFWELRYIYAFWKYFPGAYSRALDQIFHDPCLHSTLNGMFLILVFMKCCQAEVSVFYQKLFPSESTPGVNKSKQFIPLPFIFKKHCHPSSPFDFL